MQCETSDRCLALHCGGGVRGGDCTQQGLSSSPVSLSHLILCSPNSQSEHGEQWVEGSESGGGGVVEESAAVSGEWVHVVGGSGGPW